MSLFYASPFSLSFGENIIISIAAVNAKGSSSVYTTPSGYAIKTKPRSAPSLTIGAGSGYNLIVVNWSSLTANNDTGG